jgi:hypothetical protein
MKPLLRSFPHQRKHQQRHPQKVAKLLLRLHKTLPTLLQTL